MLTNHIEFSTDIQKKDAQCLTDLYNNSLFSYNAEHSLYFHLYCINIEVLMWHSLFNEVIKNMWILFKLFIDFMQSLVMVFFLTAVTDYIQSCS
jgi:hypothetical protein